MADGIVTFFLQKLSDLLLQEASILHGAEGQLKLLQIELPYMQLFIQNADAERRYDKRFKLLVNQIRDVTFNAEDVVDEFVFKLNLQRRYEQKFFFIRWLKRCSRFPRTYQLLHNLNEQIRVINVRIEKIGSIKSRYNFDDLSSSEANSTKDVTPWKKGLSDIEEVEMVGILDGFVAVKEMLLDEGTQRRVVAIVGMGGLGKTTLARRLYNSYEVNHCFECRSWISISQNYNIRELLLRIAKDVMSFTDDEKKKLDEIKEVDELGAKVRDCLKERHYFIVMDDIWAEMDWEGLKSYLPDSDNGSRILLTSRNKNVALFADPHTNPYELRHLSDEEGWDLFVRNIFRRNAVVSFEDSNVEKLGREILKICEGLPLAIVALGGLLSRTEMTVKQWQKVLDSAKWHLDEGSANSCMRILALSYNDLPYYLKSCFLYCGIFPEDHEIRADKLMRMWIAEGFVQKRANEKLEDVAEDYLEELIHRSMIQGGRRRSNGNLKSCRIHDLLRDLAISEAKETKCFEVFENTNELMITSATSSRRLIIPANPANCFTGKISHCSHLRSLVCFFSNDIMEYHHCLRSLFVSASLLRVLDFEGVDSIRTLPNEIGDLIHLKFLCMRKCLNLCRIPESIGKLVNLQTLDLRWTTKLLLPYTVWKLRQLKHLFCHKIELSISRQSWWRKQVDEVLGVYQLTNLQTLHATTGAWLKGNGGLAKAAQLKKLSLVGDDYTKEFTDSLSELTGLQTLKWNSPRIVHLTLQLSNHSRLYKLHLHTRLSELPRTTAFYPPNLMELRLLASHLKEDPMLILEKLPQLRILVMEAKAYVGRKMVCASEGFPQLHSLQLQDLYRVKQWEIEELSMPVLRKLEIADFDNLKMFPRGLLHLTASLQEIKLVNASPKLVDEVKHMQGEEWDKIRAMTIIKNWE